MRDPRNDAVQDGDRSGLAFVCAVSIANQEVPRLFRTYRAPRISQDAGPDCDIWQAARATTAAPKYFPEITIDGSNGPETYADGALGFNNPAKFVLTEATDVFGSDRPFGCLVSIGSGLSPVIHLPRPKGWRKFVPFNAAGLVKNLAAIVTNCEKTHAELAKRFEKFPNSYFRFNLPEGAADVRLDEFEKMDKLAKATAEYLHDAEVSRRVEVLARILMENRPQGIRLGDTCGMPPRVHSSLIEIIADISLGVAARSVPLSKENTQQMKTRGRSSDDFTGREAILAEVKGFFGRRPGGVASRKECLLYGIGGVGKTEIALKLAEHFEAEDAQDKRYGRHSPMMSPVANYTKTNYIGLMK